MDLEAPLVTCLSFGEETSWKSKLMNEMLNPHQKAFWYQGLRGGDCKLKSIAKNGGSCLVSAR